MGNLLGCGFGVPMFIGVVVCISLGNVLVLDVFFGSECDVVLAQLLLLRFFLWNHSTSPSGGNQVDGLPPALSLSAGRSPSLGTLPCRCDF